MRFNFFTIILSLSVLFFIGCGNSNTDKITVGNGLIYTETEQGIEIVTKEKIIALNIELSGEIEREDILTSDNSLVIMKETNKRTNIYIAKKDDISENIVIKLKNYKKGKINIIESIKSISEVEIVDSKNIYRNTTNVLLGDFNNDDVVNLIDFAKLEENFLTTNGLYDIGPATKGLDDWKDIYCHASGDGIVDLSDLVVFANNFNKTKPIIKDKDIEVESISINVSRQNLKVGETVNISAVISPLNATNRSITWSVSDSNVLTVNGIDEIGVITARAAGTSTVTITSANGKTNSVTITVDKKEEEKITGIEVYAKFSHIWAWGKNGSGEVNEFKTWPGQAMEDATGDWKKWYFADAKSIELIFSNGGNGQTGDLVVSEEGRYWYVNGKFETSNPDVDTEAPTVELGVKAAKVENETNYYEDETVNMILNIKDNNDKNPIAYYTLDGTNASTGSILYKTGDIITIKNNTILSVYTVDNSGNTATYSFTFKTGVDATPPVVTTNIAVGRYDDPQQIKLIITDKDPNAKAYYTLDGTTPTVNSTLYVKDSIINISTSTLIKVLAIDSANNEKVYTFNYSIGKIIKSSRTDFREETVYFLMPSRFYDGDPSNNRYQRVADTGGNRANNDPGWRGDFKGLIEKLDYIKALGFSAIWITPPVLNRSDADYHGYHAWDMTKIDGRLESPGATYQDLINEIHKRDMKIMQDVVWNHSSRYGEKNLNPPKLWGDENDPQWGSGTKMDYYDKYNPDFEYDGVSIEPISGKNFYNGDTYQKEKPTNLWWNPDLSAWGTKTQWVSNEGYAVWNFQWPDSALGAGLYDPKYYHTDFLKNWEDYTCQSGTIHPDCIDLNTEGKEVQDYLIDTYTKYIEMGVDAFRVDTAKHISRVMINRHFAPAFKKAGGDDFYMAGEVLTKIFEVWNKGVAPLSAPFYTWKEGANSVSSGIGDTYSSDDVIAAKEGYDAEMARGVQGQPESNNHLLDGNTYREPNYSQASGFSVIDCHMHVNFSDAGSAYNVKGNDKYYNDATYNLVYVDSHDYGPATSGERYAGGKEAWAENISLMFTFRGIPTLYYGSEIQFKAGMPVDGDPNKLALANSGRAYFGDEIEGSVTTTDFGIWSNATGAMANALNNPVSKHLMALNRIRREIPALQKGQYSTEGINNSGVAAFKRRYTKDGIDSMALVTISGGATFTGVPNGTWVDVITGDIQNGTTVTANCSGKGNLRVYVLNGSKIDGLMGEYIK